jgi:hypothetical protein
MAPCLERTVPVECKTATGAGSANGYKRTPPVLDTKGDIPLEVDGGTVGQTI